jgi:undecaprenyl-diphosphatase
MTLLQSAILGIVEGVTEFLPISSTGHLIITSSLLGVAQSDFVKSFEIIIQLGAIAAVVFLYWRSFLAIETLKKVAVAFLPTAAVGLALYKIIKTYLIGNETVVLWAMFLGGIALIAFEYAHRDKPQGEAASLTYTQALLIGVAQSVAVIPGVSRSAATILGGLALGLKRSAIVEFSFILAVPTMLAATGLDVVKNASSFSGADIWSLLIGFVTAFVVAIFSIKFLLAFVRRRNFVPFGIYRVLAAIVFWFLIF